MTTGDFIDVIEVNLLAAVRLTIETDDVLRDGGSAVNVSSLAALDNSRSTTSLEGRNRGSSVRWRWRGLPESG
jgi:NAD(P)-dependent dehydrogenase (short-subunit alcohol dehydrogenase family)